MIYYDVEFTGPGDDPKAVWTSTGRSHPNFKTAEDDAERIADRGFKTRVVEVSMTVHVTYQAKRPVKSD